MKDPTPPFLIKQITSICSLIDEKSTREYFCQKSKFVLEVKLNMIHSDFITNSRKTLFKFDKTPQTVHDGPKEHRRNASDLSNDEVLNVLNEDRNKSSKTLVCQPDPALIRMIYLPLLAYTHEIEEMIKSKPNQSNAFNEFLNTHIKEIFLAKGHNRNLQLTIESLAKTHDAWRAIISPEEMKSMGLTRPLLQSTVLVEQSK